MSHVSAKQVAELINSNWTGTLDQLSRRSSVGLRTIYAIRNEWTYLDFWIADKLLTTMELNATLELDTLTLPRKQRPFKHGTLNGYKYHKCRCPRCTKAHSIHVRDYRRRRKLIIAGVAE